MAEEFKIKINVEIDENQIQQEIAKAQRKINAGIRSTGGTGGTAAAGGRGLGFTGTAAAVGIGSALRRNGAMGPMGPMGPRGLLGPMGPKGPEGSEGPEGPDGRKIPPYIKKKPGTPDIPTKVLDAVPKVRTPGVVAGMDLFGAGMAFRYAGRGIKGSARWLKYQNALQLRKQRLEGQKGFKGFFGTTAQRAALKEKARQFGGKARQFAFGGVTAAGLGTAGATAIAALAAAATAAAVGLNKLSELSGRYSGATASARARTSYAKERMVQAIATNPHVVKASTKWERLWENIYTGIGKKFGGSAGPMQPWIGGDVVPMDRVPFPEGTGHANKALAVTANGMPGGFAANTTINMTPTINIEASREMFAGLDSIRSQIDQQLFKVQQDNSVMMQTLAARSYIGMI